MNCPECDHEFVYVEDEYYDKQVHILTMRCGQCCAQYEERYVFDKFVVLTKGNV